MKVIDGMSLHDIKPYVPDFQPGTRSQKWLDRNKKTMKGTTQ